MALYQRFALFGLRMLKTREQPDTSLLAFSS